MSLQGAGHIVERARGAGVVAHLRVHREGLRPSRPRKVVVIALVQRNAEIAQSRSELRTVTDRTEELDRLFVPLSRTFEVAGNLIKDSEVIEAGGFFRPSASLSRGFQGSLESDARLLRSFHDEQRTESVEGLCETTSIALLLVERYRSQDGFDPSRSLADRVEVGS